MKPREDSSLPSLTPGFTIVRRQFTLGWWTDFFHRVFPSKWLQNRLRADKNESRSLLAVDIQGHQRGGLCIVPGGQRRGLEQV